ncbi:MAG: hypothetical protein WCK49_05050 [Myxococcaceae bacterium]
MRSNGLFLFFALFLLASSSFAVLSPKELLNLLARNLMPARTQQPIISPIFEEETNNRRYVAQIQEASFSGIAYDRKLEEEALRRRRNNPQIEARLQRAALTERCIRSKENILAYIQSQTSIWDLLKRLVRNAPAATTIFERDLIENGIRDVLEGRRSEEYLVKVFIKLGLLNDADYLSYKQPE